MEATRVGIREFRENLSSYLLESEAPVTITRHGDPVGRYYPVRRKRTEAELSAFDAAAAKWQAELDAAGITEAEMNATIDQVMKEAKANRQSSR